MNQSYQNVCVAINSESPAEVWTWEHEGLDNVERLKGLQGGIEVTGLVAYAN